MRIDIERTPMQTPDGGEAIPEHHISKNFLYALLMEAVIAAGGKVVVTPKQKGNFAIWKITATGEVVIEAERIPMTTMPGVGMKA